MKAVRTAGEAQAIAPDGISYRSPDHADLPHVVKFSGGRSSAALAFMLAESGQLRPERGDVILFANTSAEHPGTYRFVRECQARLERGHGLPFLWYEFCTVEDASRGAYARRASYRLVRGVPVEDDPDGYRSHGEAFSEMLSFQGMLPNPHTRSCTAKLKLYPAHDLLAEWLGGGEGPRHAGHYAPRTFAGPEESLALHRRNGGSQGEVSYLRRVRAMTDAPPSREAQRWNEFTSAPDRRPWRGDPPRLAEIWGPGAERFVTLLGLRADEGRRIGRIESRSLLAEGSGGRECSIRTQPPGERAYFPLAQWGIGADDVAAFWRERDFALDIPEGAGNCVFCFMKGTGELARLAAAPDPERVPGAPSDIAWWTETEEIYRRETPSRGGCGVSRFGFFGLSGPTFEQVAGGDVPRRGRYAHGEPSCDCTD